MAAPRPRIAWRFIPGVFALVLAAHPADADVISGAVTGGNSGGSFVLLPTPFGAASSPANTVGNNNFNSPNLFAFDERQAVVLTAPLAVDVGGSPIATGTAVSSHYVFFDPAQGRSVEGTVDFDGDVLGVITSRGNLLASDFLAAPGISYLNPAARGLESGDLVSISGPRQIRVDWNASSPGDHIRVLTRPVPEPATAAVFGVGLAAAGAWRRVRRACR
jgi:hypothetical protein